MYKNDNSFVRLRIRRNDDKTVVLELSGHAPNFCAQGSAFFDLGSLEAKISGFSEFPISDGFEPTIEGGFWDDDGDLLVEKHISLVVRKIDGSGGLVMAIEAFTPDFEINGRSYGRGGRCDYRVSYQGLSEFVDLMNRLISGQCSEFIFDNLSTS